MTERKFASGAAVTLCCRSTLLDVSSLTAVFRKAITMIIWSGYGFIVPVVAFACFIGMEVLVEAATKDDKYYQTHGWPLFVAALIAAALLWPIGRSLSRKKIDRELVDVNTGEKVQVQSGGGHSLFFIPVEYWALIIAVGGVVALFAI